MKKVGKGLQAVNKINPFKGKTASQIEKMLTDKGFIPKGRSPITGQGSYLNPKIGRSYHLDLNHGPPKGPHVSVNRPRCSDLPARDYPIGD